MVYGASSTGARAMTSSSSPGVSLKQEGISYLCGADLPAVIVNVARSGPGSEAFRRAGRYFQATRGGGHGDYYTIVLAPKGRAGCRRPHLRGVLISEKWRVPVLVLADGLIGQMMEGVVLPEPIDPATLPRWQWPLAIRWRWVAPIITYRASTSCRTSSRLPTASALRAMGRLKKSCCAMKKSR